MSGAAEIIELSSSSDDDDATGALPDESWLHTISFAPPATSVAPVPKGKLRS